MADRILVWLSAGALAVGVSAGTLAGAGLAIADDGATGDTGGTTSSESSTTDGKTGGDKTGNDKSGEDTPVDGTDPDVGDEEDTEPADADDEQAADEADEDAPDKGNNDRFDSDRDKPRGRDQAEKESGTSRQTPDVPTVDVEDEPELEIERAPLDEPQRFGETAESTSATVTETPLVERTITPKPEPESEREAPNVVETISAAVSSTLTTLLDPLASSGAPVAPAAQPQMWTLMAAARREFETVFESPSLAGPVEAVTTSEVETVAVENSIVFTAEPTVFDRMVVSSLRVMRVVSNVIGVDIYGLFAKVLERAKPPFFLRFGLDVRQTEYEVSPGNTWQVWEFHPPNPTGKTVVAIHGGGFVVQPLVTHWRDYTDMARKTGATVIVPMYPLATTEAGSASKVVPAMAQFISDQIAARGAENVSVYADSAGTILAMSALRQLVLNDRLVPASVVLLSPAPDASLSNPAIRDIDDPVIDVDNLDFYTDGSHWADGFDPKDPMVSPLFIEDSVLAGLPPTTIYIGTLEIGLPDTLLLRDKWIAAGGAVDLVVGQGQIHDWALDGSINSQAAKVRPDIYDQLGLTVFTGQPSLIHQVVVAGLRVVNAVLSPFGGILAFTGLKVPVLASGVPPFFVTYGLDVQRDTIAGMPVYVLTPPTPTDATVVALHGGAYVAEASLFHYEMYADLARKTGATVIVPDYSLIGEPGGTADVVVPQTAELISEVIATSGAENTYVLGDSAGGGLALAAVQLLVANGSTTPGRMVLLAPWLDATVSDPASAEIFDPLLNVAGLVRYGELWAGELGPTHTWASPINGSLDGLPPITVYSGSLDLLSPQALQLRERAIAEGADITFELRNGLMHDYPIFFFLPDALDDRPSIYQALLGDASATPTATPTATAV